VSSATRLGQHSGLDANPFENETPFPTSSDDTTGMCAIASWRWSSVMMMTTFGCTMKGSTDVAVPAALVTEIGPRSAPAGTSAVRCASS
jgi:hypothetical protein